MTDPTVPIATAASAGLGAMILATLGVEPQALLWGAVGASIGLTVAPASGRVRAVLMFCAVVMMSALAGTYFAEHHMAGSIVARNAAAAATAALFHPLFTAAVAGLPALVARLTDRLGGPAR
jgi:hypothetical protein